MATTRRWTLPLTLALAAGSAPAAAATLALAPDAPCLDAAGELRARVERELGASLEASAPLDFELSVARSAERYRARLSVSGEREATARLRVLEAPDCAALLETVAVAMTLALAAEAPRAARDEPAPSGVEAADASDGRAAPAAVPLDGASELAAPREREGWSPRVSAALVVDAGTLPAASLGASAGVGVASGRFRLQALGTLLFDREVAGAASSDAGASLGFAGAGLLACAAPFGAPSARWSSRACLGWELGQLSGEGRGVARPRRGRVLWSAPRLELGGRVALSGTPWGIDVSLAAEAPLNRDDFTLGAGVIHRTPPVVGRAALGLELALD